MADRGPQTFTETPLLATYYSASAGGDRVYPGSVLHVKNANAATVTLTMVTPAGPAPSPTAPRRSWSSPATRPTATSTAWSR